MSNNLGLPDLTSSQTGKEQTINDQRAGLDAALTNILDIDLSAGSASISAAQWTQHMAFRLKNATTTGRTVTIATPSKKPGLFINDTSNTQPVSVVCGSTTIGLSTGESAVLYADGTANGLAQVSSGGGSGGSAFSGFSAYLTGPVSSPLTSDIIPFNATVEDTDTWYSTSTNYATVPAGVSRVVLSGQVQIASASNSTKFLLYINNFLSAAAVLAGSVTYKTDASETTFIIGFTTPAIPVSAGDQFQLCFQAVGGGSFQVRYENTFFAMHAV